LHKLELRLVRSATASKEFIESRDESFALYKRYQIAIHKDEPRDVNMRQWEGFLVESPLQEEYNDKGSWSAGYGSFHQQYLLDGKLIAVGVLDILPRCLSSVYLYDV